MSSQDKTEVIPLVEEDVLISKRDVTTGRVRVSTILDLVEDVARAALDEERVEVTRVPVGREVAERPAVRTDGDTVIVPVLEEVLVVEKRLMLKEELHIRRIVTTEDVAVPVTLRKQRGIVERIAPEGVPGSSLKQTAS
jgi:stress response protein YsnF